MTDHIWLIYVLVHGKWRAMGFSTAFRSRKDCVAQIVSEERNRNYFRPQRVDVPVFLKETK